MTLLRETTIDAEEAACVTHPARVAVGICHKTGDYLCELCAVRLRGQTYSVHYVSREDAVIDPPMEAWVGDPCVPAALLAVLNVPVIPFFFLALCLHVSIWICVAVSLLRKARDENYRAMVQASLLGRFQASLCLSGICTFAAWCLWMRVG